MQPGGFDQVAETISALAASATPHRWVMTAALVVTGLAHVVTAWALVPARVAGRALLAAGGVATLARGGRPAPLAERASVVHIVVATLAFLLLAVWPWFGPAPPERRSSRTGSHGPRPPS